MAEVWSGKDMTEQKKWYSLINITFQTVGQIQNKIVFHKATLCLSLIL